MAEIDAVIAGAKGQVTDGARRTVACRSSRCSAGNGCCTATCRIASACRSCTPGARARRWRRSRSRSGWPRARSTPCARRRRLNFGDGDVPTILKNIQLDIGAPPHFMDFRCRVDDANHGEFWLAHCGALLDVEPMGEEYVHGMCHAIEDPTFDATAGATNPRAQVRPLHRPPRVPAGREPHCHWTITIDPDFPPVEAHPYRWIVEKSKIATDRHRSSVRERRRGRARRLGRLLRRVRSRLRARGSLAPRARDRVAGGRGAEPPAAARVRGGRGGTLRRGGRARRWSRRSSPGSRG